MMVAKYNLFGRKISGPFTIPSGIITTEAATLEKIANEIPEVGILTTKSIGLKESAGNREPIIAQYGYMSFINAVGLRNPGAKEFKKKLNRIEIPKDKFLLVSIFGANENEFKEVAEILYECANGFELNISCPHSKKYGQIVGQDVKLVEKIVREVSSLGKPTFVKVSPNLNIREIIGHAIKAGCSGITAINTKGPELFLFNGYSVLSNKVGGVSGKAIFKQGLYCVKEIRKLTNLPIIACGGISTAEDIKKYKKAGANYFGVGSALAGMNIKEVKQYFHELLKDLETGTNNANKFLKDVNMKYRKYKVRKKIDLAEDLFILEFDDEIKIKPGQFIFIWVPQHGEKPFSVFNDKPLTLFIQKRGYFTNYLSKLRKGDYVYIRGPYGNSPKISGKVLLVGGGTGIAALSLFAKYTKKCVAVLGAKDKKHLFYELFEKFCQELYLVTENGEIGRKGLVTDGLEEIIKNIEPRYCVNCGPEQMVRAAVQIEGKYVKLDNIYSSVEFLTRCGIGLCGSCATSKGYRNCVDGTFFRPNQI